MAFCYSDHLPQTVVDIIPIGMLDGNDEIELFENYEGPITIEIFDKS